MRISDWSSDVRSSDLFCQRRVDRERDRADGQVEPLAPRTPARAQIMLHAIDDDAEARVDDAELGIESHRRGEEDRPVGAGAVEEIAVVEIAVGPDRKSTRLNSSH